MNHLTNFYKHRSEVLAEQIKILENKLKRLHEDAPQSTFVPGGKDQPVWSDQALQDRARSIKKGGLLQKVKDEDQSQEYKDIQAELGRRSKPRGGGADPDVQRGQFNTAELMAANKPQRMQDLQTEPAQRVSKYVQQKTAKPVPTTDKSYDNVEATRSRRSAETKGARQIQAAPSLLQRTSDMPDVHGIDMEGPPSALKDAPGPRTTIGPNSDWANQQRAQSNRDMVSAALSGSGSKSIPSPQQLMGVAPPTNTYSQSSSISSPASQTGGKQVSGKPFDIMMRDAQKDLMNLSQLSNQRSASQTGSPSGRKPVQATSNPLVSTFKAGGYIDRPEAAPGIGRVQLDPSDLTDEKRKEWAQKQLEQEVGATPTKKPPVTAPRMPGFFERIGSALSFGKDVAANLPYAALTTELGSESTDTQVKAGSYLMPKADKTPSRTADWLETTAGNISGLGPNLLRMLGATTRSREATLKNPNAAAAKAKYDQEMAAMLRRKVK